MSLETRIEKLEQPELYDPLHNLGEDIKAARLQMLREGPLTAAVRLERLTVELAEHEAHPPQPEWNWRARRLWECKRDALKRLMQSVAARAEKGEH